MINKIEIDEFLKCQGSYYKQHPEIPILKDHMYQALETYGISSEEKQNGNIKYMFSHWINHFQNSNLMVYVNAMQQKFLQFYRSNGDHAEECIKIYVTFAKKDMEECVIRIFEYISQNKFITDSKVSDTIRSDSVVIRVANFDAANKVINFINNDPYLSQRARKTNPFVMKMGVVGIASDKHLSYNSTIAFLITQYFKELSNYNSISFNDFRLFVNKYIDDILINQTRLQTFMYEPEFLYNKKSFDSVGEELANFYEVFKLIKMFLNFQISINDIYDHIRMTQNKDISSELTKYFNTCVENNEYGKKTNNVLKQKLLERYIKYALVKYNGVTNTLNHLQSYLNGNQNAITRDNNFRANFAKYLTPAEILFITFGNVKTYIQNINEKLELENDNVLKLLQEAFFATYNKYGYNHARTALEALITKNDLSHITNDNKNYRFRLSKYSHEEIIQQFNEIIKDSVLTNNQDVFSYALLTLLSKNFNFQFQKEKINVKHSIEKLPYYLQKVIKIIEQNSDINLTNKLVQEFLQGNISSIANIHDEDFEILKNYSQVEIQNAMHTLTKGYNHDSNQSLINYIRTLNLESKISNKHI